MTWSKYRRLLTVLLLPLLIAGAIFTTAIIHPSNYVTILCSRSALSGENCRTTDGLGNKWDEQLRKEYNAWFDIKTRTYEQNRFPSTIISGSQRYVTAVQIMEVEPYLGTDESPGSPLDQLRSLRGKDITIVFGNKDRDDRPLNPLGCNELNFEDYPESYTAGLCGIPGGVVGVKFTVGPEGNAQLSELKEAAEEETSNAREVLILGYVFGTPIFVMVFLIISGLVWMIRRATLYVQAG